ncbi:PREDICTED: sodium channel protein Nach-like, partial [Rhagoletis zephyria]|uniref:sodium channel protein Nach-like n=1 Tax=Rhagoletis zephyria TaxID=28612 RepID=UPI0008114060
MVSVSDILRSPTVVTLETNQYLVEKVPFPAVSICSVNKLSRSAVNAFIEEIRDQFDPQITPELWLQKIKLLAGIFDSGSVDFKEAAEFQKNFLDKQKYNITELLKKLAPNCDDLILKCRWAGKMQECSELFVKSFTANGYCCTFNYFRPDSGNET